MAQVSSVGESTTRQYGSIAYWDNRYQSEDYLFDWYQKWAGVKEIIKKEVSKTDKILIVGCGRSRLSEEMSKDGYTDILSTDASQVCVAANQRHYGSKLKFEVLDITDMSRFSHGEFDVVIDKGCLDCLLCGDNSTDRTLTALKHISRVLRPGGVYISISYGAPMFRTNYMSRPEFKWDVSVFCVPKPSRKPEVANITPVHPHTATADLKEACHYIYICRRNEGRQDDNNSAVLYASDSRRAPEDDVNRQEQSFGQVSGGSGQLDNTSGQLASGQLASGQLGNISGQMASGQLSGQLGSGQLGSGQLGSGQLNSGVSMDDYGDHQRLASGVTSKRWERKQISAQPLYDLDGQADDDE